jgi:hypothetical protein
LFLLSMIDSNFSFVTSLGILKILFFDLFYNRKITLFNSNLLQHLLSYQN